MRAVSNAGRSRSTACCSSCAYDRTNSTTHTISQWERTSASLRKTKTELKDLASPRPVADITAAMGKVRIEVDSLRCANHGQPEQVTLEVTRKACEDWLWTLLASGVGRGPEEEQRAARPEQPV